MENEDKIYHVTNVINIGDGSIDMKTYDIVEYVWRMFSVKERLFGDCEKRNEIKRRLQEYFKDADVISRTDIEKFGKENLRLLFAHTISSVNDDDVCYIIESLGSYWNAEHDRFADYVYATLYFDKNIIRRDFERVLKVV